MKKYILDGNKAASSVAYLFSELCSIYPITPSSPMASNIDNLSNKNTLNLFNDRVTVVQMQSEAGVAGALHGALISGSLASTFTSSQGLLLMLPNMYKIAGECLPGVIHTASRTVATHALSIFGDHSDIYAARQTGFCMLASTNVEDCYYMAAVSHLSAIKGSLPFLHFFDGFRTSHEINTLNLIDKEEFLKLIDFEKINEFKNNAINYKANIQKGMAENEDIYFQSIEARNSLYTTMPDIVNDYMQKINEIANTDYKPFNYYGVKDAKHVIVAMGSVCDTIKLVIEKENSEGKKYGLIEVHLYRPFSQKYLEKVLPESVENIAVLDRTKEAGSIGEPLYLDVVTALKEKNIQIIGGRYGLASKNTTPAQIKSVFQNLETETKNNFTIGIEDDVTHLSLKEEDYFLSLPAKEIKIYGFGSDGMVSASKNMMQILGDRFYTQGYFSYDSKKSGGVTECHLRISEKKINAPYYVTNPDLVVVTKQEYLKKFSILQNLKQGSILLVNSSNVEELKKIIEQNANEVTQTLKVYTIDAEKIALENHIKGKINKIMEVLILRLLQVPSSLEKVISSIEEEFKTKGEEVIKNNIKAISNLELNLVKIEKQTEPKEEKTFSSIYEKMDARKGNDLKVSEVLEIASGTFPGGLSLKEKRSLSNFVPKWNMQNCIQCGQCSFVCPHAVIRPFLIKDQEKGIPFLQNKEYNYLIEISEEDCTSCGLCINICPGKNGEKALSFGKMDKEKRKEVDTYFNTYHNPGIIDKFTIKGSQLAKPRFEFSGACAGCGETSYIKLLTQLYQDELIFANATGCSSIYGGSAPSTPYTLPWANSLFEDNAEFAYGMHISYKLKRQRIKKVMEESYDLVEEEVKELFKTWLSHSNDFEITQNVYKNLKGKNLPKELQDLLSYIPSRTVWAIGGDGWAYDIGFGGIDQVLSSNENIKILVLDTEVYSNTGGQMSKSSHIGQVCEFANLGKKNAKKDLFKIAMCYENVYVASISLGANMMQSLKVLKEAGEHQGPAIIIAYAPCVEHGIKGGLSCTNSEQKLAVDCGYFLLMRYLPKEEKLYLDSKEPNFDLYESFLDNETRYHALKIKDKNLASNLLNQNKEQAIKRFNYYNKIKNN